MEYGILLEDGIWNPVSYVRNYQIFQISLYKHGEYSRQLAMLGTAHPS